ncbi:lipopolysaccharide core heptose(II) kinase RfaY [Polyangium fumosum]|nr:lipopolysaccharide core heptose(II) kinase RfaY [Polyangium fumosum]
MRLTFEEKVGGGAGGEVWRAQDELDRTLAVKFFNDRAPSLMERDAVTHAKALVRVKHPSVVTVVCIDDVEHPATGDVRCALVMEYVDGPTLGALKETITPGRAWALINQLCEGVEAIHRAGLLHGDLHEGNVLVAGDELKIVDILYTHSLAEVGAKTAQNHQSEDIRALARLVRLIVASVNEFDRRMVEEAFYRATSCTRAMEVVETYRRILWPSTFLSTRTPPFVTTGIATSGDVPLLATASLIAEARHHHKRRLEELVAMRVPAFLHPGGKLLVHIVPDATAPVGGDLLASYGSMDSLRPMGCRRHDQTVRDGALLKWDNNTTLQASSYVRVTDTGVIEAAMNPANMGVKEIYPWRVEMFSVDLVESALGAQRKHGPVAPSTIVITLFNVQSYKLPPSPRHEKPASLARDIITLPEVRVHPGEANVPGAMRGAFDVLWQACGLTGSLCFTEEGLWHAKEFTW